MYANYSTAADVFPAWKESLLTGERPRLYPVGDGGFGRVRIGPGLLTLLGGPPGLGKTALTMQWVIDALRASDELSALVVNVESAPPILLDRQLSRLSGIDLGLIRDRKADAMPRDRLDFGFGQLEAVADRLAFLNGPYTLEHAAGAADDFRAGLIVIDYLQRVPPSDQAAAGDARQSLNSAMQLLRRFTDAGQAVIVVSALNRQRKQSGSTYDGAGLASFRESSEIEYGADDAYLLAADPNGDAGPGAMTLAHVKARHGEPTSLALMFDGSHQSFTAFAPEERPSSGLSADALAKLWADDGNGGAA